jgi:hypothetical protein
MKKLLILVAALATLASPVSAQAAASVEQVPFEADVLACNGDVIHLSGRLLVVFTETATPSGGFVFSAHFQPQGVMGVDLVTGTRFIATGLYTRDHCACRPQGIHGRFREPVPHPGNNGGRELHCE